MVTISYDMLNDLSTRARKFNDLEIEVKELKAQLAWAHTERNAAYRQLDCLQSNFDYVSEELAKYDRAPEQHNATAAVEHHIHKDTPVEAPPPYTAHKDTPVEAPPPYSAH